MTGTHLNTRTVKKICAFLASPKILFYALPWLMTLLVIGTVAQKDLGLYEAQRRFFSSWVTWFGPLPLPGTASTLALIALALLLKFLFYSPWRLHQAGIILSHFGVLVLLIGGLVTSLTQKEGFIALPEGGRADAASDYHARVFTVSTVQADNETLLSVPYETLSRGKAIEGLPFRLTIEKLCANCRPSPVNAKDGRRGLAAQIELNDAPPEKEAEINLAGATFRVDGAGEQHDGVYAVMEEIPHGASFKYDGRDYSFSMERAKRPLPFTLTLQDFRRDLYSGTEMPSGFASDLLINDKGTSWPAAVRMNEPLRYRGYTIYQASFSLRPDGEYSVLSVVENKGRALPYIASALIFAGLLVHLIIRLAAIRGRA